MNINKVHYMVFYRDDFNHKHLTFCKEYSDVKFYKERFDNVSVEICDYRNPDSDEDAAGPYIGHFVN